MTKTCLIWVFLFSVICFAQEQSAEYDLTVPKFIPFNSQFEVSLVTSNIPDAADLLSLQIKTSERLHLKQIEMKSFGYSSILNFVPDEDTRFLYNVDVDLNLLDIKAGEFFQVIMQLKPENILSADIEIDGHFYSNNEVKGHLGRTDEIISREITFYKPNKAAGKSLEIKEEEYFNISVIHRGIKNLQTEFWLKTSTSAITFLNILNSSGEKDFTFRINSSQILDITTKYPLIESTPNFISKKTWNHFALILSSADQTARFYCNDILAGSYRYNTDQNAFTFSFTNGTEMPLYLDLFRFISVRNDGAFNFRERSYLNYLSEEGILLEQISFDDPAELRENSDHLKSTAAAFPRSDAPIVPRAPELNVKILSHSFLLEWGGGDFKQADQYIVEKSHGNSFHPINIVSANNEIEKNYSFLDSRVEGRDIVYYRIKQINRDGSSVYSAEVKIGQGTFEPFTIEQNFPNPFNPSTSIEFELLIDSEIEIVVYNLEGSEIEKLFKGMLNKGVHKFSFDAEGLPSGIYLYKISTPEYSQTRKMILAK